MVLCVSQIRWEEETTSELENAGAHDTALTIVGLELTDGWYRIRANVDRTLKSACERGKIVLGCKLAISGAKVRRPQNASARLYPDFCFLVQLDAAGSEGTDVLKALNKSQVSPQADSDRLRALTDGFPMFSSSSPATRPASLLGTANWASRLSRSSLVSAVFRRMVDWHRSSMSSSSAPSPAGISTCVEAAVLRPGVKRRSSLGLKSGRYVANLYEGNKGFRADTSKSAARSPAR